jgi:hypothetical protein
VDVLLSIGRMTVWYIKHGSPVHPLPEVNRIIRIMRGIGITSYLTSMRKNLFYTYRREGSLAGDVSFNHLKRQCVQLEGQ